MRSVSLLFLTSLFLSAQQGGVGIAPPGGVVQPANPQAPVPETKPEDLCSIQGQVLNLVTGEFLKKATLIMNRIDVSQNTTGPPPTYTTVSDAEGKFFMKEIEPGRYSLRVMRNGFVSTTYGARGPMRPGTTLALDRGKSLKDIIFRLTPHGIIAGRILDEDGDPVPYVQVQLARSGYVQGRKQLTMSGGASTNDLGEYRIAGVAPGKYFLSATYRAVMMMPLAVDRSATPAPDEDYVPTYYPGTIDPTAAAQIELAAGSTVGGINLKLSKARTARVKGHVSQNQVSGRPNISVMLVPRNADQMSMMMTMSRNRVADAKGNFEITGVTPGSYYLRATMNANGKAISGSVPVVVGSTNVENINVTIGAGLTVTGHLRVDGESSESLSSLQLSLMPREPGAMMFGMNPGKLNDDGTFRIEDVGPGLYNLNIFGLPEGFYIKAVRSGETDVLASGLDATAGQPAPLQVVLSPHAGQLTGAVQNPATSQPAPGATVVLIPQEKDRRDVFSFYRTMTSDQSGNFSIKNLTPGDYKVFAWEDIEPGAYSDPEFVKPVESKGESVNIKEGGKPAVQLTLIPAEGPAANQNPR